MHIPTQHNPFETFSRKQFRVIFTGAGTSNPVEVMRVDSDKYAMIDWLNVRGGTGAIALYANSTDDINLLDALTSNITTGNQHFYPGRIFLAPQEVLIASAVSGGAGGDIVSGHLQVRMLLKDIEQGIDYSNEGNTDSPVIIAPPGSMILTPEDLENAGVYRQGAPETVEDWKASYGQ